MSKHTPGPWRVELHEGFAYIHADQGKGWNNPIICQLYEDFTPEDSVTIGQWLKAHDNAEANARLIAAAPELLEALKDLMPILDKAWDHGGDVFGRLHNDAVDAGQKARAAIAKATGGEA